MFRDIPQEAFGLQPIISIRDHDAVVHNYLLFKQIAESTGAESGAVLKGDVHGIGMEGSAQKLYDAGARKFFIEECIEGVQLRQLLPQEDAQIFAMAGLLSGEESACIEHRIIPCLNSFDQLDRWNLAASENGPLQAVLHLDTHMNRTGFLDEQVDELAENFQALTSHLDVLMYMSHFFSIKGDDPSYCEMQSDIMDSYLQKLPEKPVSFTCTDSAILLDNSTFNYDVLRPGIGLVNGGPNVNKPLPGGKDVLEIYVRISQIKSVGKGKTTGYGGSYTFKRDSTIAMAHIGYKDGFLRAFGATDQNPSAGFLTIAGVKAPIIGRISTGLTTLDVTDVPRDLLEQYPFAEVLGPNVWHQELADLFSCYEYFMALGRKNDKVAVYSLPEFEQAHGNKWVDC